MRKADNKDSGLEVVFSIKQMWAMSPGLKKGEAEYCDDLKYFGL